MMGRCCCQLSITFSTPNSRQASEIFSLYFYSVQLELGSLQYSTNGTAGGEFNLLTAVIAITLISADGQTLHFHWRWMEVVALARRDTKSFGRESHRTLGKWEQTGLEKKHFFCAITKFSRVVSRDNLPFSTFTALHRVVLRTLLV